MNYRKLPFVYAAAAGLMLCASLADAQDYTVYRARPLGNKVHIAGAANVHDWAMDGANIGGKFEVPAGVTLDSTQASPAGLNGKLAARAEARIPVTTLSSGTPAMDEVMLEAMDAKDHPDIEYKLTEMTLKQPHAANTPLEFDTKGELTINGVTKTIEMPVKIETVDKTKLKISSGAVPIKMPDYKVPPPVKLGVFVTKPDVTISFEWTVGVSKAAPK